MSTAATSKGSNSSKRVVLWFRGTDLRIDDNVIVHEAVKRIKSGAAAEVVPVFAYDPRWFAESRWHNGMLKTGNFRAQFLMESVLDLKDQLRGIGSDLVITFGPPERVLPSLAAGGASVFAQSEVTSEEIDAEHKVAEALEGVGASLQLFWGSTLYHLDDLPFKKQSKLIDMPDVFTPFKTACEQKVQVRAPMPAPSQGQLPLPGSNALDPSLLQLRPQNVEDLNQIVPEGSPKLVSPAKDVRAALLFAGGETEALKRLKYYLWESDLIADYFNTRNGMLGPDYSTKLAPWLAHGCVSPRRIYNEIKKYEDKRTANKSTYWVIFELIWRDFFKFFALKHGNSIFFSRGTAGRPGQRWSTNEELFSRWKQGTTGWPLVDANMRELAATGFMSNRGRQNVASFLVLDLGIDWRLGGDWFESLLIDYDVASNWGNWVSAAGLTGGRVNKFNIVKQSKDYDLQGDYIRHWIPELANVPASRIHEPWLMSKQEQELYGVQIGVDYPQAISASQMAGRTNNNSGGGGGGGRGGGSQRGPNRGGGRGRGAPSRFNERGGKNFKPRSAFEMYG